MEVKGIEQTSGNSIKAVSFSFFTSEQQRLLSVKQVTRSVTFDRLGRPQRDGLYDAALGPLDPLERCETCSLSYEDCPGHYGHIELALPTFHPLLFNELHKLLKCCCFECRTLRLGKDEKAYFVRVLKTLREGKACEAGNQLATDSLVIDEATNTGEMFLVAGPVEAVSSGDGDWSHKFVNKTCHQQELWAKTIAEIAAATPKKCSRCDAMSCTLKKDGYLRILKKPLPKRNRADNPTPSKAKKPKAQSKKEKKPDPMLSSDDDDDDDDGDIEDDAEKEEDDEDDEDEDAIMGSSVKDRGAARAPKGELPINITPLKALHLLRSAFKKDKELMELMFGVCKDGGLEAHASLFFLQTLLVPPNRFRPPIHLGDSQFEHPYNVHLKGVMQENEQVLQLLDKKGSGEADEDSDEMDSDVLMKKWMAMQAHVNEMIDSSKAEKKNAEGKGVRQELERKEGLMRMNMMGKRVNFACRSVISPDPFMNTDQVGIPEVFARKLSWPEPVNQYNARKLRQAVVNGPSAWPGANYVIDERGFKIDLSKKPLAMRSALAKQLERVGAGGVPCKVGRHLQDGDWVLVNRQPTLHKVSLMAHRVKVNRGQRVIRMHYANCKSYNADFDGDEINVHFPQDQLGRAEASELVHTDQQYIVPTDGSPVRGLIQDHIIGGVQLCQLNRFFRREEYQELVFLCFANLAADLELPNNTIKTVPPTIWKPVPLWTGKQIITTILHNLLHGDPPLNMSGACKVKGNMYNQHTHEGTLIVRGNDMLSGVLDKSHIGASANGLVHAVFEAHGPHKAGLLLTIFGRLFTHFMQVHRAFTCGVLDLMVTPDADQKRRDVLATSNWRTLSSSANFAEIEFGDDCSKVKGRELERRRKAVHKALAHLLHEEKGRKLNDGRIQQALASVTSGVIDSILPTGQMVPFPENNFEMMTATGAKGSKVNMSQICCLLGQQQLEGQRVPVMASGKTLPSFREWETDARAGGFVADRFLTGIRPQEYFFHCMAGREGLVDTAVKTSRSGYLQRCLMKHLESLTVAYDRSVRDCDGGVAQFLYGEDGIDPVKQLGLRWLPLLADNSAAVARSISPAVLESMDRNAYREHVKKVKKDAKTHDLSYKQARLLHKPLTSLGNADLMMGYVSEAYEDYIEDFMEKMVKGEIAKPEKTSVATLRQLAFLKYARSMVHPGEAVGAVAAQSVGEPSTQMTLNTFHSAGQGNATAGIPRLRELIMTASKKPANPTMTLRLVEGAGKGKEGGSRRMRHCQEAAESVAQELSRVCVAELISGVEVPAISYARSMRCPVKDCIARGKNGGYARRYEVKVGLEKEEMLPAGLKKSKSARAALGGVLKGRFVLRVLLAVEKEIKSDAKSRGLDITEAASERRRAEPTEEEEEKEEGGKANDDADGESSEGEVEEEEGEEGGAKAEAKRRDKKGYSEAEKADKKAVRKGAEKPGAADDDEDDEDDDEEGDEVMEEKEDPEWSEEAITLVPYTLREQSRLKIMKDKYHVSVNLEDGGKKGGGQLTFSLTVGAGMKRVMLVQLVEDEAAKCVVQELQGIDKCHVLEPSKKAGGDKECSILTEGVNLDLLSLWRVNHHKTVAGILDLNKVRCNDIAQIRRVYGVEAARRALLEEIGGVFKAYGIGVDNRHLTLISDTMMYAGDHRPLNRIGINHNSSPLLKMSFETTCKFLTDASLSAEEDLLTSPSSRLIVGRPVATGTGFFDVRQKLLAGKARKA